MKPGLRYCIKQMNKKMDWSNICKLTSSGFVIDQVWKLKTTNRCGSPSPRQENNRKGPEKKETVF